MFYAVISLLSQSASREISEREAELINRLGYYKEMRSGMKRSRVVNTVFKEYPIGDDRKIDATKFTDGHEEGDRNYLSYNKLFAKVADDTNPLKIKRITVLSVNICDFLLMSNGNSWSSCHFINRSGTYQGCYKAGTLSYSNDGTSMCFYTLPETYEGNRWYMEKKITRQLFFYENGLLLQSRLYPKGGDASGESYGDYRAVVQDIIAKCIEKPNLWKKVDDGWYNKEFVYDRSWDGGNWCYGGWYDNYDYYDSKNKSKSKSKVKPVSKEVSLIPDDAYLQSSDGDWIEVGEEIDDFFVDDSGTVYVYDSEYLMVIPLFEYVAISANGVPCKMDPDNSFMVEVEE